VTRHHVDKEFMDRDEDQQVGGQTMLEYGIPADDLAGLNANLAGDINIGRSQANQDVLMPRLFGAFGLLARRMLRSRLDHR
jgi:hypothetical protein